MPQPLSNQVVVVTGASSGIGRATALEFGRRGSKVVAAARNEHALATLVEAVRAAGGDALAIRTDVAVRPHTATAALSTQVSIRP
jgi:NADP-dependent 3-hydroxy acid dehydrogenase YdfG